MEHRILKEDQNVLIELGRNKESTKGIKEKSMLEMGMDRKQGSDLSLKNKNSSSEAFHFLKLDTFSQ